MPEVPPIQLDEDIALMIQAQKGDRDAYARLYEKYTPLVKRYIVRHNGRGGSPEDLSQEVFTRVWCCRRRYRPIAPLRSYFLGVAANVLREERARVRAATDMVRIAPSVDTDQHAPPSQLESEERVQTVLVLLANLSFRQRQAVELVYLAELPPDEAARLLGCSVTAIYSYLSSARRRFYRAICSTQKYDEI